MIGWRTARASGCAGCERVVRAVELGRYDGPNDKPGVFVGQALVFPGSSLRGSETSHTALHPSTLRIIKGGLTIFRCSPSGGSSKKPLARSFQSPFAHRMIGASRADKLDNLGRPKEQS